MWEFQNIYIRSDATTVINQRFNLSEAFTKLMRLLDIWDGKGSGWIIDQVQDIHININNYNPLAESNYISLPAELQNSMKRLINIKNTKDIECFKWCHIRLLNSIKIHPERINKLDRKMAESLDYSSIKFLIKEKRLSQN